MGSYVSVYNDVAMPVTVKYTLRGGGTPDGGTHERQLNYDQENKAKYTLSLAMTVVVTYKEPGSPEVTKTKNIFTPGSDKHTLSIKVSDIIGNHPSLEIDGTPQVGWVNTATIYNESGVIEPSFKHKLHWGLKDSEGSSEKVSFSLTAVAEKTFKGIFSASISATFGTENESWVEKSLTKYQEYEITIPNIPPKTNLIIQQQEARFSFKGDYEDTFVITGQAYRIRTEPNPGALEDVHDAWSHFAIEDGQEVKLNDATTNVALMPATEIDEDVLEVPLTPV